MDNDPLSRNNVTVWGNPEASRSLVFVNGLGTLQSCWNQITPAFADEFSLVLFDHTGALEASRPWFFAHQGHYLNVSGYAHDLVDIIQALALERVTLVGHSIGGLASLLAAARKPNLIERLVLLGVSPRYADDGDYRGGFSEADIAATYTALSGDYEAWARQYARVAMGNPERPHLAQRFAESLLSIPQEMMLTVLCSVLQTDHRRDLAEVQQPVLLLQARDDFFVPPAVAAYLQTHLPRCTLQFIEAHGHLPHISAPEVVIAAMQDFVLAP